MEYEYKFKHDEESVSKALDCDEEKTEEYLEEICEPGLSISEILEQITDDDMSLNEKIFAAFMLGYL